MKVITVPILPFKMLQSHIIHDTKTIIVDTGKPGSTKKILAALRKHNIANDSVSMILLTHSHLDHAGSAAELQKVLKVPIAIHKLEKEYVENGTRLKLTPKDWFGKLFLKSPITKEDVDKFKVDIELEGGEDLNPYGVDAKVIFTPGHTPGSVSVLLANQEILAGDAVSGGILLGGIINSDVAMWPIFHSDTINSIESLKEIIKLSPTKIHVGHGGPLDVPSIENFISDQETKIVHID
jgi:hydroxyacylglutathione hydrolase